MTVSDGITAAWKLKRIVGYAGEWGYKSAFMCCKSKIISLVK
jgi:hypothetical protein